MCLWGSPIFSVCCTPLSTIHTRHVSLRQAGGCEWAQAPLLMDGLLSKCLRRMSCCCLLHSDFPTPGHSTDSLHHLILKFFCFQISGLFWSVVWRGQSGADPRGDRGETQEKEVYCTHGSERRHTIQSHMGKHQGHQEAKHRSQGRVQAPPITGVSVGKANKGRWRI